MSKIKPENDLGNFATPANILIECTFCDREMITFMDSYYLILSKLILMDPRDPIGSKQINFCEDHYQFIETVRPIITYGLRSVEEEEDEQN